MPLVFLSKGKLREQEMPTSDINFHELHVPKNQQKYIADCVAVGRFGGGGNYSERCEQRLKSIVGVAGPFF